VVFAKGEKALLETDALATVVADSGIETVNGAVDAMFCLGKIRRVLEQAEVTFSCPIIEAFWRSSRHNWLFLNRLDTFAALSGLATFCVDQHIYRRVQKSLGCPDQKPG